GGLLFFPSVFFFLAQEKKLRGDERSGDRPGRKKSPRGSRFFTFAVPEKTAQNGKHKPGDERCFSSSLSRTGHPLAHCSGKLFRAVDGPVKRQGFYRANQAGSLFCGARDQKR